MTHASNEARYGGSVTLDGDDRPWPLSEIVEADELARLLGIKAGTIRQHLNAGTGSSWLPRPAGKVAGAWVWIRSQLDLEAIQAARVPRGRHAPKSEPDGTPALEHDPTHPDAAEPAIGAMPRRKPSPAEAVGGGWWDDEGDAPRA